MVARLDVVVLLVRLRERVVNDTALALPKDMSGAQIDATRAVAATT